MTESHSMPTTQTATTSIHTSATPDNTSVGATQLQSPQAGQLISQLSNVLQLLTTSLSGNALTNNPHPQVSMINSNSAEVLSEASDNPPVNAPINPRAAATITDNPHTSTTDNLYTTAAEPLFSAGQIYSSTAATSPSHCASPKLTPFGEDSQFTYTPPQQQHVQFEQCTITVICLLQSSLIILFSLQAQSHPCPVRSLLQYYVSFYPRQACAHLNTRHIVLELGQPPQQQQLG